MDNIVFCQATLGSTGNDFSDFTKCDTLSVEEFDAAAFFQQLSLSFAAYIADSEVEYLSKINFTNFKITGDKTKLQEVFWNLLKNAFEASKPDNRVRLTAKPMDKHVVITISDTGCGISKEHLPTIFEPFVTYKEGGTGLGLAICKQIIEAHEGTIAVESEFGVGTTFYVTLKTE